MTQYILIFWFHFGAQGYYSELQIMVPNPEACEAIAIELAPQLHPIKIDCKRVKVI